MKSVSGLDPSEITTYPVFFDLDQDYSQSSPDQTYQELDNINDMGLARPMVMQERDPYTGEESKTLKRKERIT